MIENRNIAHQWDLIKPHFWSAFSDSSDTEVFASNLLLYTINKFNNSLYNYSNAISKMVELNLETFNGEDYVTDTYKYEDEGVAVTILSINKGISVVHNKLRKSFFYMRLLQDQHDKIANKPELKIMGNMVDCLVKAEKLKKYDAKAKTIPVEALAGAVILTVEGSSGIQPCSQHYALAIVALAMVATMGHQPATTVVWEKQLFCVYSCKSGHN